MSEVKCSSPICKTNADGSRGVMFTPGDVDGIAKIWCPECIRTSTEIQFFTSNTAQMIRGVYKSYIDTELPREVKLILEQFAREIVQKLNEEL